jgi:hypothetical protein
LQYREYPLLLSNVSYSHRIQQNSDNDPLENHIATLSQYVANCRRFKSDLASTHILFGTFHRYIVMICWKKMAKRITHWYSEGFIRQLSKVDQELLQREAPAVDYTKLTVHTDTGLGTLLMTARDQINTVLRRWCSKPDMHPEYSGLLAACESMKRLPQSKIDGDNQALGQSGLYSKVTCVDFHRLLVGTLLAYGHALEGFGLSRMTGIDVLRCADELWLCTTLLWRIAYSHMLTQHMTLLVEKKLLVFPTNDEENTRESREYTGFTHKFTAKRYPVSTHDSDDDESDEIVDSTSLNSALSWMRLQASHSQACRIITKFASHAQASIRFSLLAVEYPVPKLASNVMNNWQATIRELFSQDAATTALNTVKPSYADNVVKALDDKIKAALAADRCNPIFHKFNPSSIIKYSGNIHCEAALASLIVLLILRIYNSNDTSLFTPVLFHSHS